MAETKKGGCRWSCYGSPCKKEFTNADGLCEQHAKMRCGLCGGPSDTGCDHCGQFVCGAPVCTRCGPMCAAHGGVRRVVDPELKGLNEDLERAIFDAFGTGADKVQDAAEAVLEVMERRGLIPKGQAAALGRRIQRKMGAR